MANDREKEMLELVDRIADLDKQIYPAHRELAKLEGELRLIEARHAREIWGGRDKAGKPLYPNERTREAEMRLRLHEDAAYQRIRGKLDEVRLRLKELTIAHNRLQDKKEVLMLTTGARAMEEKGED